MVVIEGEYRLEGFRHRRYDIDPSGERFLLLKVAGATGSEGPSQPWLTIVLNWEQELLERVPVD